MPTKSTKELEIELKRIKAFIERTQVQKSIIDE